METKEVENHTEQTGNEQKWFAMRDLTRSNAKLPAYRLLGQKGIEVFTPMKSIFRQKDGKQIR